VHVEPALYADQGGPRPARPPYRIPRGRSFMPVPPQQSQGVRFPLSVRRTGTRPRVLPRIRQGHAFLPVPPQSGSSPFQYYAVQPGARPRWAPPRRVSAGRVFLPGLGQQPQGARFPLFARQAGTRRLPPLPRAQRGRYSRVMRIPVTQQALAHWAAAGQMHATAFLARHAAMSPMTATGRMTIRGTRQAYATAAFHATGAMHASGVTVRPGTVHLTASGHMSASAAMVRVSRIRLTAAGTMRITGTVARRGAIAMHATGTMTVKGTRGQPAAAHWTAAGSMHAAASMTRTARLQLSGTGAMGITATVTSGVMLRASGAMTVAARDTVTAQLPMAAQGTMAVEAGAAPPGYLIQIEPGAVTATETVIDSGAWQVQEEPPGPGEVTVEEIEPGY